MSPTPPPTTIWTQAGPLDVEDNAPPPSTDEPPRKTAAPFPPPHRDSRRRAGPHHQPKKLTMNEKPAILIDVFQNSYGSRCEVAFASMTGCKDRQPHFSRRFTPDEARDVAARLIAAASLAEANNREREDWGLD